MDNFLIDNGQCLWFIVLIYIANCIEFKKLSIIHYFIIH